MQLVKSLFPILKLITIICLISCNNIYSKEKPINKCLNKKNNFVCGDPFVFLKNYGINIDKDIIQLSNLQLYRKKTTNNLKGIYIDSNNIIYYIKKANPITEFMGSRLMNLIVGTKCTPIVKIVSDQKFTVASIELLNFKTQKDQDITNKTILGETEINIAMDFIGLVDRHQGNMGFVKDFKDPEILRRARVDFDASFDFESNFIGEHSLGTNYLNLKHLRSSANRYPKNEVINAIKKIINIPDEKIIMVIFQAWATLTRAGYVLELNHCLAFAHQLIERKKAFLDVLKDKNSFINQLVDKKQVIHKKVNKQPKKK